LYLPKITQKPQDNQQLSKLQKDFNHNVAKIAQLKEKLIDYKLKVEGLNQKIASDFLPIEKATLEVDIAIVWQWDKLYELNFFRAKEKEKIVDIITTEALKLYQITDNQAFEKLYNKYQGENAFEEEAKLKKEFEQEMLKNVFGHDVNFGNFDPNSDEKMAEFWSELNSKKQPKTKTAKQLAKKEEKAKAEAQSISKATRAIYADLVKAFHPDREKDEAKKNEKTEVMKRITTAYEKDDMYTLLSLKLELLGADNDSFDLADNHLKYYLKLLREQAKELEMELYGLEKHCQNMFPRVLNFFRLNAQQLTIEYKTLENILKNKKKQMEAHLKFIKDKENAKAYLKHYSIDEY
jgi:hypothetical protein